MFISYRILFLVVALTNYAPYSFTQKTFNITTYGAKGDSKTNNTKAIQSAIDAANKNGRGKVVVPSGYFITGPLRLKTGVELHLSEGAVLLGSTKRLDYGNGDAAPLIGAENQQNISLSGKGMINGQGRELVKDLFGLLHEGKLEDEQWRIKRPTERHRPRILVFKNCQDISVKGITLKNGAGWIQDYVNCTDVVIDSIRVESTEYWNNDGIDIVNSKNVKITNCYVDVTDDGICLKSEGGPGWCENVYVANCTLRTSASGFKLGTGSHGGFKKITVRNIHVFNTYRSTVALESVDGGFLEDVDIRNVTATNTGNAILIRLGHRNKDEKYSTLKNVYIGDVKVTVPAGKPDIGYPVEGPPQKYPHNVFPSSITGLPGHPVQNVTLENIEITYEGGGRKEIAHFGTDSLENVPENMAGYPEFSMFGELPAWGLYVRHVKGLQMKNIKLVSKGDDYRAAIIFDDVNSLKLEGLEIPRVSTSPVIILNKVENHALNRLNLPFEESKAIHIQ
jgi:polygalacturonase